jgi:hypothetical protein
LLLTLGLISDKRVPPAQLRAVIVNVAASRLINCRFRDEARASAAAGAAHEVPRPEN